MKYYALVQAPSKDAAKHAVANVGVAPGYSPVPQGVLDAVSEAIDSLPDPQLTKTGAGASTGMVQQNVYVRVYGVLGPPTASCSITTSIT